MPRLAYVAIRRGTQKGTRVDAKNKHVSYASLGNSALMYAMSTYIIVRYCVKWRSVATCRLLYEMPTHSYDIAYSSEVLRRPAFTACIFSAFCALRYAKSKRTNLTYLISSRTFGVEYWKQKVRSFYASIRNTTLLHAIAYYCEGITLRYFTQ